MVLVTLLPYAVMQRADIAGMRQPSMATGARGRGRPLGRGLRQHRACSSRCWAPTWPGR